MPFFDYACECGEITEVMCSRSELDTRVEVCGVCGKTMKRKLNANPIHYAGEPPREWTPLKKSKPKSQVRSVHEIKRSN